MNNLQSQLLVYMHHLCRREAVEVGRGGVAVCADVFAVKQVAYLKVNRQFLCKRYCVESVACRTKYGANLCLAFLKGFKMVLAMVEDYP